MGSISNFSSSYLQSILNSTVQNSASSIIASGNGAAPLGNGLQTDTNQLSPFAQTLSTLQHLQQSDPAEYQQVTQQIATNLQAAAQTATANGNSPAASQLNQLATDFATASQTGQLPSIQDLAEASGSGNGHGQSQSHGHHHHYHASASSSDSANTSRATSQSTSSLNPLEIISSVLSGAAASASS